jgi:hypothetical protein
MELNALIKVRRDALLLEPVAKAESEIVKRQGSKRMTRGTKE